MGYHIVYPGSPGYTADIPAIEKDGGTGAWRDAKKVLRQWYLDEAAALRSATEKNYFQVTPMKSVQSGILEEELVS